MEKSILLSSLIMLSVITAFTSIRNEKMPVAPVSREVKSFIRDTVPDNLNENESVNENENVNVTGNDDVNRDEPSKAERRQRQKSKRDAEKNMERKQKELEQIQKKLEEIQVNVNSGIHFNNEKIQKQIIDLQTEINLQNKNVQFQLQNAQQKLQFAQVDKAMKDIDMQKINQDVQKALAAVDMQKFNRDIQVATTKALEQKKLMETLTLRRGTMTDDVSSILEFLEENNVADAKDIKSFTLNDDELIVNGKKQESSLHQQLRERYIRDKDDHIIYSNSNGTKSITIKRNDPS